MSSNNNSGFLTRLGDSRTSGPVTLAFDRLPERDLNAAAEIAFVDATIADRDALIAGLKPGVQVVLLDGRSDALGQIATFLAGRSAISAIHIIANGSAGRIEFGAGSLALGDLAAHQAQLAAIGAALAPGGDVLLWSCNTGADALGQAFVTAFARATGADVGASSDLTGAASRGGDWVLETVSGQVDAGAPLTAEGIETFDGLLDGAPPVVNVGAAQNAAPATAIVIAGITVTDAGDETGRVTVRLSVEHGTLTVRTNIPSGITASHLVGAASGAEITIVARPAQINAMIAGGGLTYKGDTGYLGADSLTVKVDDSAPRPLFTTGSLDELIPDGSQLAIGAHDLNGDSEPDLVISLGSSRYDNFNRAEREFSTVEIPGMGASLRLGAFEYAQDFAFGDFDNDGVDDIVVLTQSEFGGMAPEYATRLILWSAATWESTILAHVPVPSGLISADLDGDGRLDLLTTGTDGSVTILLQTQPGIFAAPASFNVGQAIASVAAGDFDGDGAIDLVIGTRSSTADARLLLARGDGQGGFATPELLWTGPRDVTAIEVADFDGDTVADFAFATFRINTSYDSILHIARSDGAGGFVQNTSTITFRQVKDLVATDLNRDGNADLAVATNSGVLLRAGNGDGTFTDGGELPYAVEDLGTAFQILAADVDQDGDPDLIVSRANEYPSILFFQNGNVIVHSVTATKSLNVAEPNENPVAVADTLLLDDLESTNWINVLDNDSDDDSDALTATLETGPSHGTVTDWGNGEFVYEPGATFTGTDSFTYRVEDGKGGFAIGTVTVGLVPPPNEDPIATDDALDAVSGETLVFYPVDLLTNDYDLDSDALTIELLSDPINGTLVENLDGSFSYTPDEGHIGFDEFQYRVFDGTSYSNAAIVRIATTLAQEDPIAFDDSFTMDEDGVYESTFSVLGNDSDANGDPLTASLFEAPVNGIITLNSSGYFTYTPNPGFSGTDSFVYLTEDGKGGSANATVWITVNAVNDAPAVTNFQGDTASFTEAQNYVLLDTGAAVAVADVDSDDFAGGKLTVSVSGNKVGTEDRLGFVSGTGSPITTSGNQVLINSVAIGTFSASGVGLDRVFEFNANATPARVASLLAWLSYTNTNPVNPSTAQRTISYELTDGDGGTTTWTSNVTVVGVNDAPEQNGPAAELADAAANAPYLVTLEQLLEGWSDPEGDTLSITGLTASHGTVTGDAVSGWTITPNAGFGALMTLNYAVSDGNDGSTIASLSYDVIAPDNIAPVLNITAPLTVAVGDEVALGAPGASGVDMATLADGTYIAVWQSLYNGVLHLFSQRFDGAGQALAAAAPIDPMASERRGEASVTALDGGLYLIAWTAPDAEYNGLYGQIFAYDGTAQGDPFAINAGIPHDQRAADLAAIPGGGFAAAWTMDGEDVFLRLFDAEGTPLTGDIQIDAASPNVLSSARVAVLQSGDIVVTWMSNEDGGYEGIYAQRFNAAGVAQGSPFVVNTMIQGGQFDAEIIALDNGGFAIVYSSDWEENFTNDIMIQRFDALGAKVGPETIVNAGATDGEQIFPAITKMKDGGFVVTWDSISDETNYHDIFAQRFDAAGAAVGSPFLVNTFTAEEQIYPVVVAADSGFAIAWEGYLPGDSFGLSLRHYGAAFAATEQTPLDLKGAIRLHDDDPDAILTVTLTVGYGTLTLDPRSSGATIVSGNGTGSVVASGTLAQLNALLWTDVGSKVDYTATASASPPATTSFTVSIFDGEFTTTKALTIQIADINAVPELRGTPATLANGTEDTPYVLTAAQLLQGWVDPEGGSLTVTSITPTNGTATTSDGGLTWTITPTANYSGLVKFTYTVSDGNGSAGGTGSYTLAGTNDAHTGTVVVGGAPIQGEVLTARSTLADLDGMGTLHYQWQRDTGSGFVDVGSDQATYTLGAADIGGMIRVVVSYTDGGGTLESATATMTSTIGGDTRTTNVVYDVMNNKPWTSITTKYDALGGMESQTFALDNGGVWVNNYDTANVSPILWASKRYDAANNFLQRVTAFDNGTYQLTLYDAKNEYGWYSMTISYDANWVQTGVTGLRDNFTSGITQGEVDQVLDGAMWFATPYDPNFSSTATDDTITGGSGADILYGFGGNDTIFGMDGSDFIVGGRGNDILTGGAGTDTFSFRIGDGNDTITDFESGTDLIDLHGYGITSFADLLAKMAQDGDDVVITLDAENSIILQDVQIVELSSGDFTWS